MFVLLCGGVFVVYLVVCVLCVLFDVLVVCKFGVLFDFEFVMGVIVMGGVMYL